MPKISVIVPVYNVEKYLNRCVDSILNQAYADFELILVDDGSPDNSGKICDEYALSDSRVKVIHKDNGGVSAARNVGIDNAKGEYITFIDSDDTIEKTFFDHAINHIKNIDLYISGLVMLTFNNENITKKDEYTINESSCLSVTELYENVNITFPQICICGPWCKIYKANVINENNIRFDTTLSLGEDTMFNLLYCENIENVYFDKSIFYTYYRENENSLFSKYHKDTYEIHKKVYDAWRDLINKINVNDNARNAFEQNYLNLMLGCIHHIFKHTKSKEERKAIIEHVSYNERVRMHKIYNGNKKNKMLLWLLKHNKKRIVKLIFDAKYR